MPAILRSCPTRPGEARPNLTKTFTPEGVVAYGDAYRFDMSPLALDSFAEMVDVLDWLTTQSDHCIIRGDAIEPGCAQRRCLRDQPNGDKATILPAPAGVQWIMLDIDKRPAPAGLTTNEERLAFLVSKLPPEFHDTTFYYKWSSSAGRNGWDYLSCHLWFWLETPQHCSNLHLRASRDGDWYNLVDPAPYTPNQIHYTSAPIFSGLADPCAGFRSGVVQGLRPTAPITRYVEPYRPRPVFTPRQLEQRAPGRQTRELIGEIGAPYFHEAIRKVLAHYVAVTPRDAWEPQALFAEVKAATIGSRRDYLHAREIDQYLTRLWEGAVFKFGRAE